MHFHLGGVLVERGEVRLALCFRVVLQCLEEIVLSLLGLSWRGHVDVVVQTPLAERLPEFSVGLCQRSALLFLLFFTKLVERHEGGSVAVTRLFYGPLLGHLLLYGRAFFR